MTSRQRINALPKYVVSTTLQAPEWANTSVVVHGDLAHEVSRLEQKTDQNILMHGYGPVAKTLARHALLDELHLWIHPMLAGVGGSSDMLISEGLNKRLTLLDVKALASGVVILSYPLT